MILHLLKKVETQIKHVKEREANKNNSEMI